MTTHDSPPVAGETRRDLRRRLRAARRALPPRERLHAADAVARALLSMPELANATRIAGYWAVDGELSLHALLGRLQRAHYCLPLIQDDNSLLFAPWSTGDAIIANRYGIPEPATEARLLPEQLDVVLVPLVGFDRAGNRLGSGAGFYDRTFAFLHGMPRPTRPLLVGVAYAMQEVSALAAEAWDVPLDRIVTEHGVIDD